MAIRCSLNCLRIHSHQVYFIKKGGHLSILPRFYLYGRIVAEWLVVMKKPVLSEMTLREKIGQMLAPHQWDMFGKIETCFDFKPADMDQVRANYAREQIGTFRGEQVGVYYTDPRHFKFDDSGTTDEGLLGYGKVKILPAPYKAYVEELGSYMKIPPLVAGDFANGANNVFEGMTRIVNATAIGAADSEELTFALGAAVAREMRCGGHNWRWCPVLDLANRNHTCCMRTFAVDDPERTVKLSKAYINGMQSEGVAACAKHFPSDGRLEDRDGHFTATSNTQSLEEWWSEQGKVYQEIFDAGVYSVMIGHTSFPAVDDTLVNGQYIPSTLSKKVLIDLLKGQMGFKGVVITDGIAMGGLFNLMPYEELIIALVNAGNDVILGSKMSSGELIEQAVLDGRIPMERIDDGCQRVLDMKEKLGMFEDGYYDLPYTAEDVVDETKRISDEIACRSMTLVRDRHNLLPVDKSKIKKVSIIASTHADGFMHQLNALKESFEKRGMEVSIQRRLKSTPELKTISDNSDLIIYAAYVAPHQPLGAMRLFGEEARTFFYAFNHGKEKSIGVSFGYPYVHYDTMENAPTFVNAYSPAPEAMESFVQGIFGEIEMLGKSPVLLIPRVSTR